MYSIAAVAEPGHGRHFDFSHITMTQKLKMFICYNHVELRYEVVLAKYLKLHDQHEILKQLNVMSHYGFNI